MRAFLILFFLFLTSGCTVLHRSVTIDESSTFNDSFGYNHNNALYGINFSAAKDTSYIKRPRIKGVNLIQIGCQFIWGRIKQSWRALL